MAIKTELEKKVNGVAAPELADQVSPEQEMVATATEAVNQVEQMNRQPENEAEVAEFTGAYQQQMAQREQSEVAPLSVEEQVLNKQFQESGITTEQASQAMSFGDNPAQGGSWLKKLVSKMMKSTRRMLGVK